MKDITCDVLSGKRGIRVQISDQHPYFLQHQVLEHKVLPGVVYIDLAIQAVKKIYPEFLITSVEDGIWLRPIIANQRNTYVEIQLTLDKTLNHIFYEVLHQNQRCGSGVIKQKAENYNGKFLDFDAGITIASVSHRRINHNTVYKAFSEMGIVYGAHFSRISYVDIHENKAFSLLKNSNTISFDFVNLLDAAFQSGMVISIGEHQDSLMPFSFRTICFHNPLFQINGACYYVITEKKSKFRTEITICNEQLQKLISVIDLGVKPSLLTTHKL